jgi:endonuclease-3
MATTISKTRTLNHLLGPAASGQDSSAPPLPVLEQFIFALCRENATAEQAQQAFANLKAQFFDWNEVRVSTTRELEEALAGLSDPENRAQRLVSFLQEVFEETFSFDLELLQKKGLKQAHKKLMSYGAANDYVGAWVVQRGLGGHAIPVDAATQRCTRRLGLVDAVPEDPEAVRSTLEHLVPKAKGPRFTDAVSALAEEHCWEIDPNCPGCPLNADCPTAQEAGLEQLATARASRAKPR